MTSIQHTSLTKTYKMRCHLKILYIHIIYKSKSNLENRILINTQPADDHDDMIRIQSLPSEIVTINPLHRWVSLT